MPQTSAGVQSNISSKGVETEGASEQVKSAAMPFSEKCERGGAPEQVQSAERVIRPLS